MAKAKATKAKLFVVFYEIIGSRTNGSYLVNAKNKAAAKRIVRDIDEDYVCRGTCLTLEDYATDSGYESVQDCMADELIEQSDIDKVKCDGDFHQLECGT